jgi:hypothetical protein
VRRSKKGSRGTSLTAGVPLRYGAAESRLGRPLRHPLSRAGRCWGRTGPRSATSSWSNTIATRPKKTSPTWSDVKAKLADFDRAGLLGVVQDLYASSKDNQAFLHARFGLGVDLLGPYKVTIDRWLWPDIIRNQSTSVFTARKAIADYKKAAGQPDGLAEGRPAEANWSEAGFHAHLHGPEEMTQAGGNRGSGWSAITRR